MVAAARVCKKEAGDRSGRALKVNEASGNQCLGGYDRRQVGRRWRRCPGRRVIAHHERHQCVAISNTVEVLEPLSDIELPLLVLNPLRRILLVMTCETIFI